MFLITLTLLLTKEQKQNAQLEQQRKFTYINQKHYLLL